MFDKLIRGGRMVDGTGTPAFEADLAITGEKIAAIGTLVNAQATEVVNVRGKIVCPGFVDAHVHGDLMLLSPLAGEVSEAAIRQGITTFILGQDGCSYAPASPTTLQYFREYCAGFNGNPDTLCRGWNWSTVDEYLTRFDRRTALNVAFLVPNGTVRMEVMGLQQRKATAD